MSISKSKFNLNVILSKEELETLFNGGTVMYETPIANIGLVPEGVVIMPCSVAAGARVERRRIMDMIEAKEIMTMQELLQYLEEK